MSNVLEEKIQKNKGIAMGVDAVLDNAIYDEPSRRKENYLTSIDPNFNESIMNDDNNFDDIEQNLINKKKQQTEESLLFKDIEDNFNNHNGNNNGHDDGDILMDSQKKKQIGERYNEYQKQAYNRNYTPARVDPFSTPNIQQSLMKMDQNNEDSKIRKGPTIPESRIQEVQDTEIRSYKDVMQERELEREKLDFVRTIEGKKPLYSSNGNENSKHDQEEEERLDDDDDDDDDIKSKYKREQKQNLKRRWDVE